MKCYKNIIVIICFFVFACVKVAWADSYTIVFGTGSNTDAATTSTTCASIVSSGGSFLSGTLVTATNVFPNGPDGLRLNKSGSSSRGTIKMNLSDEVIPTSIVVRAKKWSGDNSVRLTVNGITNASYLTEQWVDYTFNITTSIVYLELMTDANGSGSGNERRLWVQSITVNYTTGESHTLSSAVSPAGSGSVSPISTTLSENGIAEVTATPNPGYAFDHWSISGTGASLSSTSANPTTVTMGTADAMVTAHFDLIVPHTVTFNACTGTCATASLTEASGGAGVVLPSATAPNCDSQYEFYGWATSQSSITTTAPEIVGTAGARYYPTADVTLYAVYVLYSGNCEKVTTDLDNWAGQYLIVYEAGNKAFDGSLTTLDATSNNIPVTITSNTITSNSTTIASSFVISKVGSSYTIRSASGKYIGRTANSNGMDENISPLYNTISHNGTSVSIVSSAGPSLQYNQQSEQTRFRYFKTTMQQPIQLYRRGGTYDSNPSCTCPAISGLSTSSITINSASLSWTAGGSETTWQLVMSDTELGNPSTGTIHSLTTTSYSATGLTAGTTHYAYVRADCGGGDYSSWRMVQFETPCVDRTATLNCPSVPIAPGSYYDLVLSITGEGGVTWSSSNPNVATVNGSGRVTAVAEGYCVITATVAAATQYCGATVTCNIHVSDSDCPRVGWSNSASAGSEAAYSNSNLYEYSYTQQLYSATEIRMAGGRAGKINSIKIRHKGTATTISDIYMASTMQENLEDDYLRSGFVQVAANKTINYTDGWTDIELTTPFQWDGESNIVVAFNNHRTALGSLSGCITHQVTWDYNYLGQYNCRLRYTLDGAAIPLISYVPENSTSAGREERSYRSDIKFCITPCSSPVDAYFSSDELNMTLSSTLNLATLLTVNPTGGVVTYTSSNPAVATVSSSGAVTSGSNEGSVVITANVAETADGKCSANAYITINVCNCSSGESQCQIGASANYGIANGPVNNNYNYSYRQIIYPAEQLTKGTIKSIAFYYESETPMSNKDSDVDIYMGLTEKSEFLTQTSADWVTAGLELVYTGSLKCTQQGWNKFNFNQNGNKFEYNDACKNIVVVINDRSGTKDGVDYKFAYSTSTKKVQLYANRNDNSYTTPPANAAAIVSYYPNVKFCMVETAATSHTLTYVVSGNCTGTTMPLSVDPVTATSVEVTSVIPSCPDFVGFKGWNTQVDGRGKYYYAGDRINLACNDVTLYAIYANEVHGESSCENAVAFCNSNSISFTVQPSAGQTYGNFCAYFNSPGTWWYMQIDQPGDLYMTISSTAGDVDFACWGPFDNMSCDLADLSDDGANGWYYCNNANEHECTGANVYEKSTPSTPICEAYTLARPSGNLVDYGGSASGEEYLQILDAQHGEYYMIIVANYANNSGRITFTKTGGAGSASCDIVTNCDITSISATPNCTSTRTYDVSGEIAFRDAPVDADATLVITDGTHSHTFTPPFSSPTPFSFTGLPANGENVTLTATFTSSTINCSKTSSYTAPTKISCGFDPLPVELLSLHATCNGKRALISWTTASEHNNDYFVVERSDDAVNFVEVGRVAGAGNSIEMLSYNYADYSIRTGDNYYRLTQVDYDGTRTTSEIIEVHCSGNVPLGDPDVYVYPNPFGDELTVHLVNFGDVAAHIQVYDMLGRMLFERTADDTEVVLQLGALPDAAYTVRVSTADFVVNKKVVKNN